MISGDKYSGDPQNEVVLVRWVKFDFDKPKSVNLT